MYEKMLLECGYKKIFEKKFLSCDKKKEKS